MDNDSGSTTFFDAMMPRTMTWFKVPIYKAFGANEYHCRTVRSRWKLEKLAEKYRDKLLRSDCQTNASKVDQRNDRIKRLLFRLEELVFVDVEDDEVTVFASTAATAAKVAEDLFKEFAEPEREKPQFYILTTKYGEVDVESVVVDKPFLIDDLEMALHYGDDFPQWERKFVEALTERPSGVSILRGTPGTGKTSLLRHLIFKMRSTHRFYIFPVDQFGSLSRPELTEFWKKQNNDGRKFQNIVLIEDAESVIADGENRQRLSNLLNIGDGLFGEFLRVHVLLTINCPVNRLDPALIRPGRLVGFREFKRLSREQALRLAIAKGITLPEQADYSLAEIYNVRVDSELADRRIGFAA